MTDSAHDTRVEALTLEGLHTRFPNFKLGPLSVSLPPTGVIALLGPNGSGKTTLLAAIEARLATMGIDVAMLPQSVVPPSRVLLLDFLEYASWLKGLNRREAQARIESVTGQLELGQYTKRRLGELSGGVLRRALIGEALLTSPRVLLLDEPSSGLDIEQRVSLSSVIQTVSEQCCVIISSHIVSDLSAVSDHVWVLHNGALKINRRIGEFLGAGGRRDDAAWEQAYLSAITIQEPS